MGFAWWLDGEEIELREMRDPSVRNPVPRGRAARVAARGKRGGLLGHVAKSKPRSPLRVREPRRLLWGLTREESAALLGSFRTCGTGRLPD